MLVQLLTGSFLGTVLFAIYLEGNPKIQNVWYRKNDRNEYEIKLENIIEYYKIPLKNDLFWHPSFWDINPYVFTTSVTIAYTCLYKTIM